MGVRVAGAPGRVRCQAAVRAMRLARDGSRSHALVQPACGSHESVHESVQELVQASVGSAVRQASSASHGHMHHMVLGALQRFHDFTTGCCASVRRAMLV